MFHWGQMHKSTVQTLIYVTHGFWHPVRPETVSSSKNKVQRCHKFWVIHVFLSEVTYKQQWGIGSIRGPSRCGSGILGVLQVYV